jgi:hypothetical protein
MLFTAGPWAVRKTHDPSGGGSVMYQLLSAKHCLLLQLQNVRLLLLHQRRLCLLLLLPLPAVIVAHLEGFNSLCTVLGAVYTCNFE